MKTNQSPNQVQESTYALLVRSEEKERSLFEAVAYGLTILSAVAAIWQFAAQPVKLPVDALPHTASVAQAEVVSGS
jgi:hypothetical protein